MLANFRGDWLSRLQIPAPRSLLTESDLRGLPFDSSSGNSIAIGVFFRKPPVCPCSALSSEHLDESTQEMGIRQALGATGHDVLRLVVSQGMRIVLLGLAIGLAASLAVTRMLQSLLFQISAFDVWTFIAVSVLLASVALLACLIPARRATKISPMTALRSE